MNIKIILEEIFWQPKIKNKSNLYLSYIIYLWLGKARKYM